MAAACDLGGRIEWRSEALEGAGVLNGDMANGPFSRARGI